MKILALDSSNQALSVALVEDGRLQAETLLAVKKNHSISLMPVVDFLVAQVGWTPKDLDRIVVAQGPGSYTGLRVAVATVKTLAYTLKIDLVGLSSLQSLVPPSLTGLVVPLIDARRNCVYAGVYENGRAVEPDRYWSFEDLLSSLSGKENITFVGEVENFMEQIEQALPTAQYQASLPSAYQLAVIGQDLPAVDVTSFEPNYLKHVEAEENWLKDNQVGSESYIKRV
ncbi:tRNA (adenosine(37)-N6)-threonylcarbamoyltransferase complex dimerization subunit type 1 TsaB [Streptococcus suis]|uniref:tRNA (adenosine(37)-N6)-threonylcarbamoyltransferase complex dimerization subunit type 1 TsaB n=1 Tax=Streptococcus suis TaxID=1307 RepID=UPI0025AFCC86|nr:tRNA (adenosine(37)-N6)-threonylcarbamoyltransferase complex dimerization subunit type 1 TsaB [Streptococcus suis]MDN2953076.1 tRNA (adenosine(37)-N6)-threonylcarbamoyltransferase complex dimerization subunit type 1 TsaB [Streptococcus suis]MDN2974098.1 tRNA (adenosine(37)-N6)-threonylcarbamoyltransferase complex dimerization subunit type 1 TsaB [Streptococcus suis]MDN2978091.1 tRNA (adenosine(37)-N6)-threonylcarbamoyltransferase complex dimerization subunit type 1 TsaB [Streptococcus suis]M